MNPVAVAVQKTFHREPEITHVTLRLLGSLCGRFASLVAMSSVVRRHLGLGGEELGALGALEPVSLHLILVLARLVSHHC